MSEERPTPAATVGAGPRAVSFQNGTIYFDPATGATHVGQWVTYVGRSGAASGQVPRPMHVASAPVSPPSPDFRAGCPAGTSNYPGAQAAFNCLTNFKDPDGNLVGLRVGRVSPGGFGRLHYRVKHYIEDRWVELIIQDTTRVQELDRDPDGFAFRQEYVYGENYVIDGQSVQGIRVGEDQGMPPRDPGAPDGYAIGVVTAYCTDGSGNPITLCPEQLPSPFLRTEGYPPDPNAPFH